MVKVVRNKKSLLEGSPLGSGDANIELIKILDLMAKRNFLAKEYTDFERDRDRVAKDQEKAITSAPRFQFADDIQRWGVAVGDANQQLSRLRDTFLQVNPAMQGFYKTQMSFYESVRNLEESTAKTTKGVFREIPRRA